MKHPISHPSRPRRAALVLLAATLPLGCKKDEPAPPADAPPAEAPAEAEGDALPEKPDPPPKAGGASKSGGIAALTKGLIDDVKAAPGDPLALVPSSAVLVAQIQVVPFKLLPFWEAGRAAVMSKVDGDDARVIEAFRDCELDLDQLQSVTFAMVEGKHGMAVVNGPGFGLVKNHTCARDRLRAAGEGADYDLADHEGEKRIVLDEGESHGYFLGDDTVLIVDKELDAEIAALRQGKGISLETAGELKPAIARAKTDGHAWFAARVVDFLKSEMGSAPIGTMHELWGSASYEGELSVAFGARLDDASAATSARDMAQKQLDEMKAMLPMVGVSASTAAKITFGAEDDRFTFAMSLTDAEMTSIQSAMKGML